MADRQLALLVLALWFGGAAAADVKYDVLLDEQISRTGTSDELRTTKANDVQTFTFSNPAGVFTGTVELTVELPLPEGRLNEVTNEIVFDTPLTLKRQLRVEMTLNKWDDPRQQDYHSYFFSYFTENHSASALTCKEQTSLVSREPQKKIELTHTAICSFDKLKSSLFSGKYPLGVSHTIDLTTFTPFGIHSLTSYGGATFSALESCPVNHKSSCAPILQVDLIDPQCPSAPGLRCKSAASFPPDAIIASDVVRKGVVSDGNARLALRARAPADKVSPNATVTFALKKNGAAADSKWGKLGTGFYPVTTESSVTVPFSHASPDGKTRYAIAYYLAPEGHPEPFQRNGAIEAEVTLTAVSSANSAETVEAAIAIVPPPVVLVPGEWSDRKALEGLENHLKAAGFHVCAQCRTNIASVGSFDPRDEASASVLGYVDIAIYRGLRDARKRHYAATRVDAVGHGMGGVALRAHLFDKFRPPRRAYEQNDLHKIITVGAPHQGSPLVNWLLRHKCDAFSWYADWLGGRQANIEDELEKSGRPLGPGIYGLQTVSSPLSHIGAGVVKGHAIVGVAPFRPATERGLNDILRLTGNKNAQGMPLTIRDIFGELEHDVIVPVDSQAGGNPATTVIDPIVHADWSKDGTDVGEMESEEVWARIVELLEAPVQGPLFGYFKHYDAASGVDPPIGNFSCGSNKRAAPFTRAAPTATITPAEGTKVKAGDAVLLTLNAPGSTAPEGAYFTAGPLAWVVEGSGPVFSDTWIVPKDRAGRVEVAGRTFGSGTHYGVGSYVIVEPPQEPVSLRLTPSEVYLDNTARLAGFTVLGVLPDGSEIDLSSGSAGTTYAIAAGGEGVIAMREEGVVESVGEGTTAVTATYKGLSATAPVTVELTYAYQGLWWNAPAGSESGWGINFAHQGDVIFATWFTYDAEGKPTWLIALLNRTGGETYSGPVSRVTGPPFNAQPFDPEQVAETEVGTMTVAFADVDHATLAYTVNGISRIKSIVRQEFATPLPRCTWGGAPDLARATNFQDLWWNAPAGSESGWGINFTHQGDVIFATWFTYDAAGKPWWLIALLNKTATNVYAGEVFTVTGPPFQAEPFDTSKVVETVVGNAKVTFADGNAGSFAYTVNGISQTKPIARQVFVEPGTACF